MQLGATQCIAGDTATKYTQDGLPRVYGGAFGPFQDGNSGVFSFRYQIRQSPI
jgi:hypothetical protein